jgi:hypothetical protein
MLPNVRYQAQARSKVRFDDLSTRRLSPHDIGLPCKSESTRLCQVIHLPFELKITVFSLLNYIFLLSSFDGIPTHCQPFSSNPLIHGGAKSCHSGRVQTICSSRPLSLRLQGVRPSHSQTCRRPQLGKSQKRPAVRRIAIGSLGCTFNERSRLRCTLF